MKPSCQSFWLFGSLTLSWLATTSSLQAQIVQDATLPNSSIVTPTGNTNVITGGTTAGSNLFHSFEQFSVPTNGSAIFDNATNIQNIISRVTGSFESNINGLIQANGTANLFLLNPNGIIFGPNARLSIGGSFLASTASGLNFADKTEFSATNSSITKPLLTVSVPVGLQFGRPAGRIEVQQGASLQVQSGKTQGLVGGELTLVGGRLTAVGGRIELGSVAGVTPNFVPVQVSLTPIDKGWALGYEGVQNFQDIRLSQQATVSVSGSAGGDIQVQGRRVTLTDGSRMFANTVGSGLGGTLGVSASESVEIEGEGSGLFSLVSPAATGTGTDLLIETRRLQVQDGAQVSTATSATSGSGKAGNLTVLAADLVELSGIGSRLGSTVQPRANGDGGNLNIETGRLRVWDGAQVLTSTFGQGNAGNLTVQNATEVELVGSIVAVDGRPIPSGLFAQTAAAATGTGGNLSISTEKLTVRDGAQVNSTTSGIRRAGDLTVKATDVELVGVALSADGELLTNDKGLPFPSGLFAGTGIGSSGNGGTLSVETNRLSLRDGAAVQTSTLGQGDAGNLRVQATDLVELIGTAKGSQFPTSLVAVSGGIPGFPGVIEATGKGGDLSIETGELIVQDGAAVAVSSLSTASDAKGAGNLEVQARTIRLNNKGKLTSETASGDGGDITLQELDLLLLRNNSQISTTAGTAQKGGDGGNITINTGFIVAVPRENSDIIANAFTGRGGTIQITAQGIFGLIPRSLEELKTLLRTDDPNQLNPARLFSSDITAISQTDPSLSGQVTLNIPDVQPSWGLATLPAELVDVTRLIAQGCPGSGGDVGRGVSKFMITGRGGLPPSPSEVLRSESVRVDLRAPTLPTGNHLGGAITTQAPRSTAMLLVEAQGWVTNAKGEVALTATAPTLTPHSFWLTPNNCHVSKNSS